MKKKIITLLLLLAAVVPTMAQQPNWGQPQNWGPPQGPQAQGQQQGKQQANQQQRKFDPQEFAKRMEDYIAMKAGLTKDESEKFFPIYREYKAKQRDLTFKQQRLQREKPTNDGEYNNVITQIANLSVQIAKLDQTYFPRMCKVIPAKKVYIAIQAENDFHRDMIRQPMMQWGGGMMPQWGGPQQQQRNGTNGQQRNGVNNQQRNGQPWGGGNRNWNGNGQQQQQKKN